MDWKNYGKKLLFPPLWIIGILSVFSAAALIYVFVNQISETPFAYIAYVIAFYTLSVVCIYSYATLPRQIQRLRRRIFNTRLGRRYKEDVEFRTHITLYSSLGANLAYVGINLLSYMLYHSMWFVCLGVYYGILAIMRFLLVRYVRRNSLWKNPFGELKRTVLCSYILLTVNFALSGAVLMILYQDKGYEYHGVLIYAMAAYTFYITTQAVMDLIKYRKYKSPVITMTKVIALSASLVSMLALETAMFSQFGQEMEAEEQWLMVALTGAGVSIAVVTMSLVMICRSYKELKNLRGNL